MKAPEPEGRLFRPWPPGELPCIWMHAGLIRFKLCERAYECEGCPIDAALRGPRREAPEEPAAARRPRFPDDRRYLPTHLWVQPNGAHLRCGLDAFAAALLTRLSGVVLPPVDTGLRRGRAAAWLIHAGEPLRVRAPLDGRVVQVNHGIREHPELLRAEPYDTGYLFEMQAAKDWRRVTGLTDARGAEQRARDDLGVLARRLESGATVEKRVGPTAADGGDLVRDAVDTIGLPRYNRVLRSLIG